LQNDGALNFVQFFWTTLYINKINGGRHQMSFNILHSTEYLIQWMCRN